jgi:hypothetical protein
MTVCVLKNSAPTTCQKQSEQLNDYEQLDRGEHHHLPAPNLPTFAEQSRDADNKLLPSKSTALQQYNLRLRVHDRQLPFKHNQFTDFDFIYRMLYLDSY